MEADSRKIVFISCGQQTEDEKRLGNKIRELVEEITPFRAYLAEDQTSVAGLTTNIFENLAQAEGFIAVMHRRGRVVSSESEKKFFRASVFVEQEVAIAAFLQQAGGKKLHVAAYIENDIKREGVRGFIQFNPKAFAREQEVLDDLEQRLPGWVPPAPVLPLELVLSVQRKISYESQAERSIHRLNVGLKNVTTKTFDSKFRVEVRMPKGSVDANLWSRNGVYVPNRSSAEVDFFRPTKENMGVGEIYPDDTRHLVSLDYSLKDVPATRTKALVTLFVDDLDAVAKEVELGPA